MSTLEHARQWLRARLEDGDHCPCCSQFAKVYKRTITATSARALITIYQAGGASDFVHIPTVMRRKQADEAKLVYWGLIEKLDTVRSDGSTRAGYWRITPRGVAWLRGETTVPKYAHIYDGHLQRLSGPPITVTDALGTPFSYADLMAGQ